MTKTTIVASILWAISAFIGPARADAVLEGFDNPNRVPDSYIIAFSDLPELGLMDPDDAQATGESRWSIHAHNKARVEEVAREMALQYGGRITALYWISTCGFAGVFSTARILEMSRDPRISRIEADHVIRVQ